MEYNVYAPPTAGVADPPHSATDLHEYYVVSKTKFMVLFFATLGTYTLYWFYAHWARFRRRHNQKMWPVARAIFPVFFTHSLAEEVDASLKRTGVPHRWSPNLLATVYVVIAIVGGVCDRLAGREIGSPITDVIGLLSLLPMAYTLWRIQVAANHATGQPEGESNRHFTWANWVWIALYGMVWLLLLVGLGMTFGLIPE